MSTPPVEEAHQPIEDIRPIVEPESVPVQVPESSTTYYHFEAIRNDGQAIIGSNIYAGGNVNLGMSTESYPPLRFKKGDERSIVPSYSDWY